MASLNSPPDGSQLHIQTRHVPVTTPRQFCICSRWLVSHQWIYIRSFEVNMDSHSVWVNRLCVRLFLSYQNGVMIFITFLLWSSYSFHSVHFCPLVDPSPFQRVAPIVSLLACCCVSTLSLWFHHQDSVLTLLSWSDNLYSFIREYHQISLLCRICTERSLCKNTVLYQDGILS